MYKIVRVFMKRDRKVTVKRNLTLEEAQAHCHNPETTSSKATSSEAKRRTKKYGPWMDTYEEQ